MWLTFNDEINSWIWEILNWQLTVNGINHLFRISPDSPDWVCCAQIFRRTRTLAFSKSGNFGKKVCCSWGKKKKVVKFHFHSGTEFKLWQHTSDQYQKSFIWHFWIKLCERCNVYEGFHCHTSPNLPNIQSHIQGDI